MPISDRFPFAMLVCVCCLAGPAEALDANAQPEGKAPPIESFKSVTDALKAGVRGLNAGDKPGAAKALNYAATKGDIAAQFKLGRMYAEGDGVEQDDYRAFRLYQQIANANAEEVRGTMKAGVVAKAFVQLGSYYLDGIPGSPVKANPDRAYEMFHYAASYFGDPDAQYNVGRMYLDGAHGEKDARQAARWFNLAAEKGHPYAQAVLGQILFNGQNGVPRQAPLGLSWMLLARDACDPHKDAWIFDMTRKAETAASDDERRMAKTYARKFARATPAGEAP
ncbi:MAG TPA: tetratricopeptide repeat protein, partial [Beijerinckiaceae bacterium]|nr:tetratricopeptide repeat protein [Beijerinckiaceae bacterium]